MEKDQVLVLEGATGIVWVCGMRIDDRGHRLERLRGYWSVAAHAVVLAHFMNTKPANRPCI